MFADRDRIAQPKADLDALGFDLAALLAALEPLLPIPSPTAPPSSPASTASRPTPSTCSSAPRRFSLPLSGWGFVYERRRTAFAGLLAQVRDLVVLWDARLVDFQTRMTAYDQLPLGTAEDVRLKALRTAELLVSTALEPLPAADLRPALDLKRDAFFDRRDELADCARHDQLVVREHASRRAGTPAAHRLRCAAVRRVGVRGRRSHTRRGPRQVAPRTRGGARSPPCGGASPARHTRRVRVGDRSR